MGKPVESRSHAKGVSLSNAGRTAADIRAAKNSRSAKRNADRKEQRIAEATARNAKWRGLTPAQQIEVLDARFGKGCGAAKQRAKIAAKITP